MRDVLKYKKKLIFFITNQLRIILLLYLMIAKTKCFADWQHYNSFLIGERAAGMGGAYTAISNDPSGIFYNPGGIAFTNDTEVSLSTAGYYVQNLKVDAFAGINDYQIQQQSSDIINGFLGFTKKITLFDNEFYLGVGIYSPDHTNIYDKFNLNKPSYFINNNIPVQRLILNSRDTGNESEYEISLSKRINNDLGVGVSIGFFDIQNDELTTINLLAGPYSQSQAYVQSGTIFNQSLTIRGLNINLGTLYKIMDKFSFGFDIDFKLPLLQNYSNNYNESYVIVDSNGVPLNGEFNNQQYTNQLSSNASNSFIKILPTKFSLGLAYHFTNNFLVSSDFNYYTGMHSDVDQFSLKAIYNYALGSEVKFIDNLAFRFGYFTNNWSDSSETNNIIINSNFIGYSVGIAYIKDNKYSYSITTIYQQAKNAEFNMEGYKGSASLNSTTVLLGLSSAL